VATRKPILATLALSFAVCLVVTILGRSSMAAGRERIVGLPCEGCDAVFVGIPASFGFHERIAPVTEHGEPMTLRGRVLDGKGAPVAGVIVYAYHTDSSGIYPANSALKGTSAIQHGRLRGWARSNEKGEYQFDTIRPGPYPGRPDPQHIHMHVIEVGRCTYYIGNVEFTDDPRLTPERQERPGLLRGGSGITTPIRDSGGTWQVTRDIHLGENIPDYASCEARR